MRRNLTVPQTLVVVWIGVVLALAIVFILTRK